MCVQIFGTATADIPLHVCEGQGTVLYVRFWFQFFESLVSFSVFSCVHSRLLGFHISPYCPISASYLTGIKMYASALTLHVLCRFESRSLYCATSTLFLQSYILNHCILVLKYLSVYLYLLLTGFLKTHWKSLSMCFCD